jgi:Exostosin family
MANIFVTTTCRITSYNPLAFRNFELVLNLSKCDSHKQHHVVDCPTNADLILFVCDRRFYHSGIYSSEIFKKYPEKSLVLDFIDRTIPRIPGLYATIPSYLQQYPIYEYLFYPYNYGCFDMENAVAAFSDYKYLFSFMGNVATYPTVRSNIVNLSHPRAYLKDTSKEASIELFSDVLMSSKFVLCPRGIAASTIRVYEAMRAGRVPVIISDEWQENTIDEKWKEFSIRIPEKDVELIPTILEKLEPKALEMGEKARLVWNKNFSMSHGFDWIVEACLRIQRSRDDYEQISSRQIYKETLGTTHFVPFWKEFIRGKIGRI